MPIVTQYFGKDLPKEDYWMSEMTIHELHREEESALMQSRWFDYLQMLPAEATYLFAAQYRYEYLEAYKRVKDIGSVDTISPFSPENIFESADLTSMWLARREADSIGCKYDFYLRMSFDRFAGRGWKNLPRPNQIHSEELTQDITTAWKIRCREVLQLADNNFFFHESYIGHPNQDRYYSWVVEQIKIREHKHLAIARVLGAGIVSPEFAEREFGVDLVQRAKRFY